MNTTQKIERLLDEAYTTDDPEEMERLARQILNYDKDNVEAIILLADVTEDSKEKIENMQKGGPIAIAEHFIVNDGSLEDLHNKLDELTQATHFCKSPLQC